MAADRVIACELHNHRRAGGCHGPRGERLDRAAFLRQLRRVRRRPVQHGHEIVIRLGVKLLEGERRRAVVARDRPVAGRLGLVLVAEEDVAAVLGERHPAVARVVLPRLRARNCEQERADFLVVTTNDDLVRAR